MDRTDVVASGIASSSDPGGLAETAASSREKKPFEAVNPWHAEMSQDRRWPLLRACKDEFSDPADISRFVNQYPFEEPAHYQFRKSEATYLGVCGSAVERLMGAVFAADPNIQVPSGDLEEWTRSVDQHGKSFLQLVQDSATEAAWIGTDVLLLTRPPVPIAELTPEELPSEDGTPGSMSKAREIELGLNKAVVHHYRAEEMIDWGPSDNAPQWVVFRKTVQRRASPMDPVKSFRTWRVVTSDSITDFEIEIGEDGKEKGEIAEVQSVLHKVGRPPVVVFPGQRISDMTGLSWVRGGARADLAKLREDCQSSASRARHANPFLRIKSDRPIKELISGGGAVRLSSDEEADYIALDSASFDIRESASERFTREGHRLTGANPSFTNEGATFGGESGIAAMVRHEQTEKRRIDTAAAGIRNAAVQLLRVAHAVIEDAPVDPNLEVGVQIITTSEIMDLSSRAQNYQRVGPDIQSPTFHRYMAERLALSLMGDAPEDIIDAVKAEIAEGSQEGPSGDANRSGAT